MKKRVIDIKVLPGQPTDGSGQACIHLFVPDPNGPFTEPRVRQMRVKPGTTGDEITGEVITAPMRGRLACDRKRTVKPVVKNNITSVTLRTDDPRATTCPWCKQSEDYKRLMKLLSDHDNRSAVTEEVTDGSARTSGAG